MTTLSVVVPSYNSADFMHRCIDSLLVGGDDVEILIVNDGSRDATGDTCLDNGARGRVVPGNHALWRDAHRVPRRSGGER